jgi:GMP synthase (glutamine-hydrolysing)
MAADATARKPVLVLHHIREPVPNAYRKELAARRVAYEEILVSDVRTLPRWDRFAGIVAFGGPMSAVDERRFHWMAQERGMIREAVRDGAPFWGVCLGAQMLAASLDATIVRGPAPEVGVVEISLCPEAGEDPVFAGAPPSFKAFALHQDTFGLPSGARWLASSAQYPNQAFVWGGTAYGLQFHLEPGRSLARHWLDKPKYSRLLTGLTGAQLHHLAREVRRQADRAAHLARKLFGRWLDQVVFAAEPLALPKSTQQKTEKTP